jgi:NOL1/NOP2/fmu family ribosome biogenesis protein
VNEWSESAVATCAARQADILDQTLPLLAPGGLLAYSTCTAAPAENGAQITRLLSHHPELGPVPLPALEALGWVAQPEGGYQAWPHRVVGEGLYLCLLRRAGEAEPLSPARRWPAELSPAPSGSLGALEPAHWLAQPDRWQPLLHRGRPVALSSEALQLLRAGLAEPEAFGASAIGLPLGERKGTDALPDHALALSPHRRADLPTLALSREAALRYLKREAFAPEAAPMQAGWHLATHQGLPLGWVKAIAGGRLNNYLPPSWRIRRDLPPEA